MSNLPLEWKDKENSPELLAYLQQFGRQFYLDAEEANQVRDAINELAKGNTNNLYQTKTEKFPITINGGGGGNIGIDSDKGYYEVISYGSPIQYLYDQQSFLYPGKEIVFRNAGTVDLVFTHNKTSSGNNRVYFTFPDNQDFTLKPNEIITFKRSDRLNYLGLIKPKEDKYFVFEQPVPDSTWTITHNLSKFPSVNVVDSAGTEVTGSVAYADENNLTIYFNGNFTGKAFIN